MKVKFVPQDVEFEIKQGQTVMDLAHEKGIAIRSTCNGMPSCAECRVRVTDGDWNVSPPSRKELSLIGTGYYIDQRRLSCQMLCFGDITVDTAEQIEKSAEGPVTKKFLTKVHKNSAQESHSLGGVLIEQDDQLMQELKKDVPDAPQPNTAASLSERSGGGRGGGGRDGGGRGGRDGGGRGGRDNRGGGGNQRRDNRGGGGNPQRGGGQQRNAGGGQSGGGIQRPGVGPILTAGANGPDGGNQDVDGVQPSAGGGPGSGGGGQSRGRRRRRGGRGRSGGGGGGGGGNSGGGPRT